MNSVERLFRLAFGLAFLVAGLVLQGCITRTPAAVGRLDAECEAVTDAVQINWPERTIGEDPWAELPSAAGWSVERLGLYGSGYLYGLSESHLLSQRGLHQTLIFRSNAPSDFDAKEIGLGMKFYSTSGHPDLEMKFRGNAVESFVMFPMSSKEPRGLVVLLGSMEAFSGPELELMNKFLERDWMVAYFTYPSTLWAAGSGVMLGADSEELAGRLGQRIDNYLGESAFAAEAVVGYLRSVKPELKRKPLVLIGASAGALAVPAAAARLGDELDACVLIGGGGDIYGVVVDGVMREGFLPRWICTVAPGETETSKELIPIDCATESFREAVLSHTALDPLHMSSSLLNKPVLLLLAAKDDVVPIANGQRLYEQLNRPERWLYPCGHEVMFFCLPYRMQHLAEWAESAVASRAHSDTHESAR